MVKARSHEAHRAERRKHGLPSVVNSKYTQKLEEIATETLARAGQQAKQGVYDGDHTKGDIV